MHFTACKGFWMLAYGSIMPRPGASAFHKRYAAWLPKQLDHNPKAHNIGHTSLTFDTS